MQQPTLLTAASDGSSSGKLGQDGQEMLTTPLWTLWAPQLQVAMTRALRTKIEEQTQRACSGRCLFPSRRLPTSSKKPVSQKPTFRERRLFHARACRSSFNYISFSVHTNERSFHQKQRERTFHPGIFKYVQKDFRKRFLFLCVITMF